MKPYFIILFIFIVSNFAFSQETLETNKPKLLLVYSDAFFIDKIVTDSNNRSVPGSDKVLPVVTHTSYLLFNLKLSISVHDNNNVLPVPLNVRVIFPNKISQILSLEKDLMLLDLEKIYDYNIEIKTKETGWFEVEIGSLSINNDFTVYDSKLVFFRK